MKDRECLRNPKYEHRRNKVVCENALQDISQELDFSELTWRFKLKIEATRTRYAAEIAKVIKNILDLRDIYVPKLFWFK
jgi:hypothetical protein